MVIVLVMLLELLVMKMVVVMAGGDPSVDGKGGGDGW